MSESLSLAEFAAAKAKQKTCRVCDLPEVDEINKTYRGGLVTQTQIRAWLTESKGYEASWITKSRLEDHFQNKHDA